jgi:methyl-accepting chemotaxis protein
MPKVDNNASPRNDPGPNSHIDTKRSFWRNMKFGIAGKLFLLTAITFVGFAIISAFSTQKIYETIKNERIDKVKSLTEVAISIINTAYDQYKSGNLSEEEAKKIAKDQIISIKYGNNDYYLSFDYDGNQIIHGSKPEREGQNFLNYVDTNGKEWVKEQIARAKGGSGVVFYTATRLGSDVRVPKLSYTIGFEPWHWAVSTGVYIDDIDTQFTQVAWQFFSVAAVIGSFMAFCGYVLSRGITRPLGRLVRFTQQPLDETPSGDFLGDLRLRDEVGSLARALQIFKANAAEAERLRVEVDAQKAQAEITRRETLFDMVATVEKETDMAVTGIDHRMAAMTKAAEAMSRSAGLVSANSQNVAAASEEALVNAQTVATATEQLSISIHEISTQVAHATTATTIAVDRSDQARTTIANLAEAVSRVSQVTTLISEIASQTNLLALNATIEAARAGNAGKGFAVVASEVKNLANQTARSTEEITRHITDIQTATKETVRGMDEVSETVRSISEIAGSIAAAVEEQNAATSEIARNVSETAGAAREVSTRIGEVSGEAARSGDEAGRVHGLAADVNEAVSSLRRIIVSAVRASTSESTL